MQVALRRGQLRVAHHVPDGHEVELLDRQAAEGVSQIVEATHSDAGLFLGADEAAADGGAIEGGAVWCSTPHRRTSSSVVIAAPASVELGVEFRTRGASRSVRYPCRMRQGMSG